MPREVRMTERVTSIMEDMSDGGHWWTIHADEEYFDSMAGMLVFFGYLNPDYSRDDDPGGNKLARAWMKFVLALCRWKRGRAFPKGQAGVDQLFREFLAEHVRRKRRRRSQRRSPQI